MRDGDRLVARLLRRARDDEPPRLDVTDRVMAEIARSASPTEGDGAGAVEAPASFVERMLAGVPRPAGLAVAGVSVAAAVVVAVAAWPHVDRLVDPLVQLVQGPPGWM